MENRHIGGNHTCLNLPRNRSYIGLKDCTAAEAIARGCTLATSPSSDGGCGPVYSRYLYADTATHLTSFAANAVDTNKTIPAMSRAGIML